MKYEKILIHFLNVSLRSIGIIFLYLGLRSFPTILSDGGITKNIFTLLLRLISLSVFIITGYGLVRLRKWSIIGIGLTIIISVLIPFYNLYFSTISYLPVEGFQFNKTVIYIVILIFILIFKNKIFTSQIERYSKEYLILDIIFAIVIISSLYAVYFFKIKSSPYDGHTTVYWPTTVPTSTPIPTIAPTPTPQQSIQKVNSYTHKFDPPYTANNIQNDQDQTSELILTDKNGFQITISQSNYLSMDNTVEKPIYSNFTFSPDYKFIYFILRSPLSPDEALLYNIEGGYKDSFVPVAENFGFSNNSKYFYACGVKEGGFNYNGGAIVKQLQPSYVLFENNYFFKCQYNKFTKIVTFLKTDINTNIIEEKYEFSEKTGSFLKIDE